MKNIKIFFLLLIVHCTLLIGEASAQWWVQGGNLLWPYGTVTVKDSFSVGGNASISGDLTADNISANANFIANDITATGNLTADNITAGSNISYSTLNGVKVYRALLSQSGTDDPVALLLENTIGAIDWTRNDLGRYTASFREYTIDPEKLFVNCARYSDNSGTVSPITINANASEITFRQNNQDLSDWGAAVIDISGTKYYPVSFILYH